jgi:hypothetical protein
MATRFSSEDQIGIEAQTCETHNPVEEKQKQFFLNEWQKNPTVSTAELLLLKIDEGYKTFQEQPKLIFFQPITTSPDYQHRVHQIIIKMKSYGAVFLSWGTWLIAATSGALQQRQGSRM